MKEVYGCAASPPRRCMTRLLIVLETPDSSCGETRLRRKERAVLIHTKDNHPISFTSVFNFFDIDIKYC